MKIIDLLNKMTNGKLEDNFKFCYDDIIFTYNKSQNRIFDKNCNDLGKLYKVEKCLNDDILLFENKEVREDEEIDKIEEFTSFLSDSHSKDTFRNYCNAQTDKINEIIRVVNKMQKENKIKEK